MFDWQLAMSHLFLGGAQDFNRLFENLPTRGDEDLSFCFPSTRMRQLASTNSLSAVEKLDVDRRAWTARFP